MTHYRVFFNPDYLGAYSLEPGQELILTIKSVGQETITGPNNRKDKCLVIHFEENVKPMIINATNGKTITKLHKSPYVENWIGKKIQVYATTVNAFGDVVEALRIRSTLPQPKAKKPVTAKQFPVLVESLKSGKLTMEKALENYELTAKQLTKLKETA